MKTAAADSLGFSELANAWAAEPGIRSHEYVLDQLLSAFWTGEFENILDSTPENWPDRRTIFRVFEICGAVPTEGLPFEDDVRPEPEGLAGVGLDAYPAPGRAVMDSIELPRDMIRLWCLDQGYDPPKFWFPEDEDKKLVGRPSVTAPSKPNSSQNGDVTDAVITLARLLARRDAREHLEAAVSHTIEIRQPSPRRRRPSDDDAR